MDEQSPPAKAADWGLESVDTIRGRISELELVMSVFVEVVGSTELDSVLDERLEELKWLLAEAQVKALTELALGIAKT